MGDFNGVVHNSETDLEGLVVVGGLGIGRGVGEQLGDPIELGLPVEDGVLGVLEGDLPGQGEVGGASEDVEVGGEVGELEVHEGVLGHPPDGSEQALGLRDPLLEEEGEREGEPLGEGQGGPLEEGEHQALVAAAEEGVGDLGGEGVGAGVAGLV